MIPAPMNLMRMMLPFTLFPLLFPVQGPSQTAYQFLRSDPRGLHPRTGRVQKLGERVSPFSSAAIQAEDSAVYDINITGSEVWMATALGASYSPDLGQTWLRFDSTNGLGRGGASGLSTTSTRALVSTSYLSGDSMNLVPTGGGISVTTNSGLSWSHFAQPADLPGDSLIAYGINDSLWILPVTGPEQNSTYDITQSANDAYISSFRGGLRRTTDDGLHWQRILLPLDDMSAIAPTDTLWYYASNDTLHLQRLFRRFDPRTHLNLLPFSVAMENDTTIWCGTSGGVNKSTDAGTSWVRYTAQNTAMTGNWTVGLHLQQSANTSVLWAATWQAASPDERSGVSFTSDGGSSWKHALINHRCYNFSSNGDTLLASCADGLFRSVDGSTWELYDSTAGTTIYDAVRDSLGRLWLATPSGLRIVSEDDTAWTLLNSGSAPTILSVTAPDTLTRPQSGFILDSVTVLVSDPDLANDVQTVWFDAYRPNGAMFSYVLDDRGEGRFTLVFMLNTTGILGTHRWVFFAMDHAGNVSDSVVHFITIIDGGVSDVHQPPIANLIFSLRQNFPNPFNPSTEIVYSISEKSYVTLTVYDLIGRPIAVLVQDVQTAGEKKVRWDASGIVSGVYLCRLTAGSASETKKLILIR